MKQPIIIGLAGRAQSGKSSLAAALETIGAQRRSFAGPLRELCYKLWPEWGTITFGANKDHEFAEPFCFSGSTLNAMSATLVREVFDGRCSSRGDRDNLFRRLAEQLAIKGDIISGRDALQWVGCLFRDHVDADWWINRFEDNLTDSGMVVVDGMRFANERACVRARGGILALIERHAAVSTAGDHISETSLGTREDYDLLLFNHGKTRLRFTDEAVMMLVETILKRGRGR